MSQRMIPTTEMATVCDLCDKPITEDDHDDEYAMRTTGGGMKAPTHDAERTWYQMWRGYRKRLGSVREEAEQGRDVDWDFHGACLVRVIRPAIESTTREDQS